MAFFPQSRSRSPSLKSFESSARSSADDGHARQRQLGELLGAGDRRASTPANSTLAGLMVPTKAKKLLKNHQRFYLPTENIFFLVESTMYSVPRAPFYAHSSDFSKKGLTHEDPLILEDVTRDHFDHFLDILYPEAYGVYSATTVDEWTAILHLAAIWGFTSIRALATRRLAPITTDVDKIVLGRQYGIDTWLAHAYHAVCMREESVNKGEGRRMGVDDVVEINTIRQQFGLGARPTGNTSLTMQEVHLRFGLLKPGSLGIGTEGAAAASSPEAQDAHSYSTEADSAAPQSVLRAPNAGSDSTPEITMPSFSAECAFSDAPALVAQPTTANRPISTQSEPIILPVPIPTAALSAKRKEKAIITPSGISEPAPPAASPQSLFAATPVSLPASLGVQASQSTDTAAIGSLELDICSAAGSLGGDGVTGANFTRAIHELEAAAGSETESACGSDSSQPTAPVIKKGKKRGKGGKKKKLNRVPIPANVLTLSKKAAKKRNGKASCQDHNSVIERSIIW